MVHLVVEEFGKIKDVVVKKFTWKTEQGLSLSAISYGAIVQSIMVPDKDGQLSDIVLGFDNIEDYLTKNQFFGAAVGRTANRTAKGKFELDGVKYTLATNNGENHLHGGTVGFDKVVWNTLVDGTKVIFSYLAKDGEEGYPGDLITNLSYEVKDDNVLYMEFFATTTKKTPVNMTNHSYFNLGGHESGAAALYNHIVSINADKITENAGLIPTGRFISVGGTAYDLRTPIALRDVIDKSPTLYDNNFCISSHGNKGINFVSRVEHPPSGRYLEIYSNQPGVQFYTSGNLPSANDPALVGKGGIGYRRRGAFCLEPQNYPNAINQPNFPSPILKPGDVYRHSIEYRFGVAKSDVPTVVSA